MASILFALLLFAQIVPQVQDPARKQLAPVPESSAVRAKRIEEIRATMKQLDSQDFQERSAASKKLEKIACLELELIKEAAITGSPEVKMRVRRLVEIYSKFSHILSDAVGNPIPNATVTVEFKAGKQELVSNGCGHLKFPEENREELLHRRPKITVSHKDYGVAWGDSFPSFPRVLPGQRRPQNFKLSLIHI